MMQSGQTQTPYIGSRISLISKSEIRYEGILYTVDTKESTIALAKVKSFGTEDRPTEHPVQGRDEIYEYIIFKASDIKDLMVCETPKPVPQLVPGLPYDPAIIQVSQNPASSTSVPTAPSMSPAVKPLMASGSSSRSGTPQHRLSPVMDAVVQPANLSRAPGAGRHNVQQSRGRGGFDRGGFDRGGYERGGYDRGSYERGGFDRSQNQQRQGFNNRMNGGGGGGFRGGFRDQQQRGYQPQPRDFRSTQYAGGRRSDEQMGGFGRRGGFPNGGRPGGGFRGQQGQRGGYVPRGSGSRGGSNERQQPLKFDSDYDFEKANEQFQETLSHLKDEVTKVKISDQEEQKKEKDDSGTETQVDVTEERDTEEHDEHDPDFYDKTKSFFDRISCEALERQEGKNNRPNWRREREINTETFGQSAVRNYAYRRGGGVRGAGERHYVNYNQMRGGSRGWRGGRGGFGRGGGYQQRGYGYSSYY